MGHLPNSCAWSSFKPKGCRLPPQHLSGRGHILIIQVRLALTGVLPETQAFHNLVTVALLPARVLIHDFTG